MSSLLSEIEEQKDKRNVVYDLDGIIYLSCYKYKDTDNIELMYMDLCMRINTIETELWKSYAIDKRVLAITSSKNFRDDLTNKWKGDRKPKPLEDMTEKQLEAYNTALKLKTLVKKVKVLVSNRLGSSIAKASKIAEADDICIDLANRENYIVVSMDSDVISQSPTPVFNYHKKHWKFEHEGNHPEDIFKSIIIDTITGGHNGKFGVKGKGKVFANDFIKELEVSEKGFTDWVDLFETPDDALLNFRVTDCGQVVDNKLKLVQITDIADMFEEYYTPPF